MDAVGKYTREEGKSVALKTMRRADGEREKVRDRKRSWKSVNRGR